MVQCDLAVSIFDVVRASWLPNFVKKGQLWTPQILIPEHLQATQGKPGCIQNRVQEPKPRSNLVNGVVWHINWPYGHGTKVNNSGSAFLFRTAQFVGRTALCPIHQSINLFPAAPFVENLLLLCIGVVCTSRMAGKIWKYASRERILIPYKRKGGLCKRDQGG